MAAKSKKSRVANPPEQKQTETWNAATVAALITAIATITVTLITTLFSFYVCRGQDKADCKGSGTPIEVK